MWTLIAKSPRATRITLFVAYSIVYPIRFWIGEHIGACRFDHDCRCTIEEPSPNCYYCSR